LGVWLDKVVVVSEVKATYRHKVTIFAGKPADFRTASIGAGEALICHSDVLICSE
jgi:hypothetical protein